MAAYLATRETTDGNDHDEDAGFQSSRVRAENDDDQKLQF